MSKKILAKDKVFTFGFNSAKDVYEKLVRDSKKLGENHRSKDECFNFSVTAWQLYNDWLENDDFILALAKTKYKNSKIFMDDMMLGLCAVANSSKHMYLWQSLRSDPNFNVVDIIYEDVTDWHKYFFAPFPTIVTKKAKYNLWKVNEILLEYFEWVFDDSAVATDLPLSIKNKLNECVS